MEDGHRWGPVGKPVFLSHLYDTKNPAAAQIPKFIWRDKFLFITRVVLGGFCLEKGGCAPYTEDIPGQGEMMMRKSMEYVYAWSIILVLFVLVYEFLISYATKKLVQN